MSLGFSPIGGDPIGAQPAGVAAPYTPPVGNAADFNFGLTGYAPPLGNQAHFNFGTNEKAHRYWRVLVSETNGSNNVAIGELELRGTGGTDLTGSGTASDNGNIGASYVGAKAFDDNNTSMWNASFNEGNYLQYDFGTPQEVTSYTLRSRNDGFLSDTPRAWALVYSDDGDNWTLAHAVSSQTGWSLGEQRAYTLDEDNSYPKYWRLAVSASNNGSNLTIAGFELREAVGGANVAVTGNGRATASNGSGGTYPVRQVLDTDAGTFWNIGGTAGHIQFEAKRGLNVKEYVITGRNDGFTTDGPKDWKLQYSHNGVVWIDADTRANETGWALGQSRNKPVQNPPPQLPVAALLAGRKPRAWMRGSRLGNSFKF